MQIDAVLEQGRENGMSEAAQAAWEQLAAEGNILANLERAEIEVLRSRSREHSCKAGENLLAAGRAGDFIYLILEGTVSIEHPGEPGKPRFVETRQAGELVGALAFFSGTANAADVRCTSDSHFAALSRDTFDALLGDCPGLWRRLQSIGLRRMRQMQLSDYLDDLFGPFGVMLPWVLKDLEDELEWISLRSGEVLYNRGDSCRGAYILMTGRLQMLAPDADGRERILHTVLAGETAGEVALLTEEPLSHTAYAARDSEVVRLSPHSFELMLQRNSRAIHNISRILGRRLDKQHHENDPARLPIRCISLIPADSTIDLTDFSLGLEAEIRSHGSTLHLRSELLANELGPPAIAQADENAAAGLRLTQWLAEQETRWRYLIYQGDPDWTVWSERCVRQTDQVVVVADADGEPNLDQINQRLSGPRRRWSLVLLHPPDKDRPRGTARWLSGCSAESVFHVRRGNRGDFARLARILTGNAVSLVLGGGGARGFAHLGVLRAMEQVGLPVDMVCGTSMGAAMAVFIAQGENSEVCNTRGKRAFAKIIDLTLPLSSLISGKLLTRTINNETAGWDMEDYWLPWFCMSTNLTTAQPVIHRRGNSSLALRASVSIPGVMPAVPSGGELLVDGGVLNNLPVDVMREMNPFGRIIAVDVVAPLGPSARSDYGTAVSGWGLLMSKLLPWKKPHPAPGLANTILQSLVLGSGLKRQQILDQGLADLYLNIHVRGVGMLQFDAQDRAIKAGYEGAIEPLKKWLEQQPLALAGPSLVGQQ